MNKYLLKIAEKHYGKAALSGVAGAHLIHLSTGPLLGYENRYHGTSTQKGKRIDLEGLSPSRGGTGAARHNQSMSAHFQRQSKKKIHTTGSKSLAKAFARYTQTRGKEDFGQSQIKSKVLPAGRVFKARLPRGMTRRMKIDPHMTGDIEHAILGDDLSKRISSTTHHGISTKQLKASKSPAGIVRYLKPNRLKKYYKDVANRGRIASGVAGLASGTALLALSKHYIDKGKNDK